ncbi:bifunctional riboflavin kinase/FAD synthetase [Ornithobacterium rhinotracheale]|uniref:bifunctional riboflavin kinase/FAD synthetase n=1 Tax=Ornithobacterium rhinotracheale TaxID=28251 RepID=UPI00129C957D|nr:bifunctional riboflavin kinase/FAD synthetase [Ornithobacterium rhinotracheale]MRI63950.1 bifunctional riboflavin kinase/FAD synthetase [Ornithobacterium rhinotracheale]
MKIVEGIQPIAESEKLVLTIGMFDGVHKGHQSIINQLNNKAEAVNGHSALLTLNPHPRHVLQSDSDFKLLSPIDEKIQLLEKYNLDYLIIQPFDFEFSRTSSLDFVRESLVKQLNIHALIIGHDHQFGRNRAGDFHQLQELSSLYNFELSQLKAIKENENPISSTKVRNALAEGNIAYATQALGRSYSLEGKVIHGDKIGRTLGFPTVNLAINDKKLVPKNGVYGVNILVDGEKFQGLMNVGIRPTIEGKNQRIEVFIFDFGDNLYEKTLKVEILNRIRDEQKFDSLEDLKNQIAKDISVFKNSEFYLG